MPHARRRFLIDLVAYAHAGAGGPERAGLRTPQQRDLEAKRSKSDLVLRADAAEIDGFAIDQHGVLAGVAGDHQMAALETKDGVARLDLGVAQTQRGLGVTADGDRRLLKATGAEKAVSQEDEDLDGRCD
ncbi:MAG: hypothetical protein IPG96_09705 [Proteobacteria bacterium]|nr:hypothetical protein [Pseudomonadota bacterium]